MSASATPVLRGAISAPCPRPRAAPMVIRAATCIRRVRKSAQGQAVRSSDIATPASSHNDWRSELYRADCEMEVRMNQPETGERR